MLFSVVSLFPGRGAVTPAEAGACLFGWSSKTVRNRLHARTFPLPLTVIGGKQVVTLTALAEALGEAAPAVLAVMSAAPIGRGRGRPRKVQRGDSFSAGGTV